MKFEVNIPDKVISELRNEGKNLNDIKWTMKRAIDSQFRTKETIVN